MGSQGTRFHVGRLGRLVACVLAAAVALGAVPGCKADEPLPPVFQWLWSGSAPAPVTAVRACGAGGPSVVVSADGTLRKVDAAGAVAWEVPQQGMTVSDVSTDDAGTRVLLTTSAAPAEGGPAQWMLTLLDGSGGAIWQVGAPAPGIRIGGEVSSDGTKVLVYWPSSDAGPASVNVRDAASGAVRWEKRTEAASAVSAAGSIDFRRVVTGYAVADGDDPSGIAEAYADDSIRTHLEMKRAVSASIIATEVAGLLEANGRLSAYELTDDGLGDRLWRRSSDKDAVMVACGGTVVVVSYDAKGKDDSVKVSAVRVYSAEGKKLFEEEYEASARYVPTLSADGRLLALVPVGATDGEVALVTRFGEELVTSELPPGVSAISFEAGDGLMLVGLTDGTYGLAKLPL